MEVFVKHAVSEGSSLPVHNALQPMHVLLQHFQEPGKTGAVLVERQGNCVATFRNGWSLGKQIACLRIRARPGLG